MSFGHGPSHRFSLFSNFFLVAFDVLELMSTQKGGVHAPLLFHNVWKPAADAFHETWLRHMGLDATASAFLNFCHVQSCLCINFCKCTIRGQEQTSA